MILTKMIPLLATTFLAAGMFAADQADTVTARNGTVTNAEGTKVDESNADARSPAEVEDLGKLLVRVRSATQAPPTGRTFKAFPTPNHGTHAFIELTESTIERLVDPDSASSVGLQVIKVHPETADGWPLQGHGNLNSGSGSGSSSPADHWAVKVGPAVRLVVDHNRDGSADIDPAKDHVDKALKSGTEIDFLGTTGALTLVNCNHSEGPSPSGVRDLDDFKVNGDQDRLDCAPLTVELLRNLLDDEEVWLRVEAVGVQPHLALNVLDPLQPGDDQLIVGGGGVADVLENRLDTGEADDNPVFKERTQKLVKDRLLIEGLRFAEEVIIHIELRRNGKVIQEDKARIRTCPWLANCNTRALADNIPNLMNSDSYAWAKDHGTARGPVPGPEFAQDGAEFGYQLRRQAAGDATARKFITCLRLKVEQEKRYAVALTSDKIGTYGFTESEAGYFEAANDGDSGGNLECLPPSLPPTADAPYGKVMLGDTVSDKLKEFITKQKAQPKAGPVIVPIKALNLDHVDEVVCVLPDGKILSLDWAAGVKLVGKASLKNKSPGFTCVGAAGKELNTYGEISTFLKSQDGLLYSKKMQVGINEAQKKINEAQPKIDEAQKKIKGSPLILVPGLYLVSVGLSSNSQPNTQRSFPRNPANSQPVTAALIMSQPPPQTFIKVIKNVPTIVPEVSIFWTTWVKTLAAYTPLGENMTGAWFKGGEVHCSSNAIRQVP